MVGKGINRACTGDKNDKIPGCLGYTTDELEKPVCAKCEDTTHYRAGSKCEAYDKALKVENCQDKEMDRDECAICKDGFTLQVVDGTQKCTKNIDECSIMNEDGKTCMSCNLGYFEKEGKCVKNIIEHCSFELNMGEVIQCALCKDTFTAMDDGKCASIEVPKCLKGVKNDTKGCSGCIEGFYPHEQKTCEEIKVKNCIHSNESLSAVKCD